MRSGHARAMPDRSYRPRCADARPEIAVGETYYVPQPLAASTWTDGEGVTWRRRGRDLLSPKQARKLLGRTDVRVMRVYDGEVHEHPHAELAALVADLEEYWAGHGHPMALFDLGELRNESHEVMVMIVEGC